MQTVSPVTLKVRCTFTAPVTGGVASTKQLRLLTAIAGAGNPTGKAIVG